MKWKWRNDRRSECNLCNCVKKPEKNSGLQRGLNPWPRDTGAMLYQLSYEATDVGSRSIVGSYVPMKEMSVVIGRWWIIQNNNKIVNWLYLYTTWFARDITAAMLVVRNKSISPLWKLNSIFR